MCEMQYCAAYETDNIAAAVGERYTLEMPDMQGRRKLEFNDVMITQVCMFRTYVWADGACLLYHTCIHGMFQHRYQTVWKGNLWFSVISNRFVFFSSQCNVKFMMYFHSMPMIL